MLIGELNIKGVSVDKKFDVNVRQITENQVEVSFQTSFLTELNLA